MAMYPVLYISTPQAILPYLILHLCMDMNVTHVNLDFRTI
jgi:hypothetical protein